MKIMKHMYGKKRTESDYVKPKLNEIDAYASRASDNEQNMTRIELEAAEMEGQKDFDRDAFDQLKKELT